MPPSKNISFDELSKYFHLPINQVAKELGVCATILKKICRRNGIPRWPHRKIKSLDKMISNLNMNLSKNPQEKEDINKEIDQLRSKKIEIMKNPDILAKGQSGEYGPMRKNKMQRGMPGTLRVRDLAFNHDGTLDEEAGAAVLSCFAPSPNHNNGNVHSNSPSSYLQVSKSSHQLIDVVDDRRNAFAEEKRNAFADHTGQGLSRRASVSAIMNNNSPTSNSMHSPRNEGRRSFVESILNSEMEHLQQQQQQGGAYRRVPLSAFPLTTIFDTKSTGIELPLPSNGPSTNNNNTSPQLETANPFGLNFSIPGFYPTHELPAFKFEERWRPAAPVSRPSLPTLEPELPSPTGTAPTTPVDTSSYPSWFFEEKNRILGK